jgi:hypothetical protein
VISSWLERLVLLGFAVFGVGLVLYLTGYFRPGQLLRPYLPRPVVSVPAVQRPAVLDEDPEVRERRETLHQAQKAFEELQIRRQLGLPIELPKDPLLATDPDEVEVEAKLPPLTEARRQEAFRELFRGQQRALIEADRQLEQSGVDPNLEPDRRRELAAEIESRQRREILNRHGFTEPEGAGILAEGIKKKWWDF